MRQVLDKLDPFFAAAAIVVAGLTAYSYVPHPIVPLDSLPAVIQAPD